jgi:hypothetical protein
MCHAGVCLHDTTATAAAATPSWGDIIGSGTIAARTVLDRQIKVP